MARIQLLLAVWAFASASAFVGPQPTRGLSLLASTSTDLSWSLTKPLGLILEEVEEGQAKGVFVKDFGEEGSALTYASELKGKRIATVMGEDVTGLTFDQVMDKIIGAPETVELEIIKEYAEGTPVKILYQQDGQDTSIDAKVGDNLRQVLLDSGIEVYQGLKQKLGNCGGGGQCTFCAMDFVESDGWLDRSEYEDGKLKKNPSARLACLNNIQGPATIKKASR